MSRAIGAKHEERACEFLSEKGWKLLAKNFTCRGGELDLVFYDPQKTVVFVEVKYRASNDYGAAQSMVTFTKQRHLSRAAMFFIQQHRLHQQSFRFDVIAVSPSEIDHIQNAFSIPQTEYTL